jgi:hypothetical protein
VAASAYVRLKKVGGGEGPVRIVWNSTLQLDIKIGDIKEARELELDRIRERQEEPKGGEQAVDGRDDRGPTEKLSNEDRQRRKGEEKQAYLERVKQEQEELGKIEQYRREKEKQEHKEEPRKKKCFQSCRRCTR